ncbi:hypothetical protein PI172_2505 [Prevotella intermedia]|uniref:Uncharacterized protein n=1 Tax=Prevotella intermedia TaxID=28131 RepID=A0AAD1F8D6_PREIN|nr:hypothetical protein PIN17_0433 [Prevotella intermedia 17]BAR96682.1 hypothetical protein PI172_1954 [Prevotella intermedia]BAR97233.1 hypothetical protein PI172_2505 [Prevotella intermedia]
MYFNEYLVSQRIRCNNKAMVDNLVFLINKVVVIKKSPISSFLFVKKSLPLKISCIFCLYFRKTP